MKILPIVLISFAISVKCQEETEDYCDPKICPHGHIHIACDSTWDFDESCPQDRKLVELRAEHIAMVLKEHNHLRNKIASGKEKGFKTASRMATMTWNDELAKLAELNVKQCKIMHDHCRNTDQLKFVGQNLGFRAASGHFEDTHSVLTKTIHSWYAEIQDAHQRDIDHCCTSVSG